MKAEDVTAGPLLQREQKSGGNCSIYNSVV
jgi:hypothetical protein